jgi:ABC-type phosphate transport system substrate-binding protein
MRLTRRWLNGERTLNFHEASALGLTRDRSAMPRWTTYRKDRPMSQPENPMSRVAPPHPTRTRDRLRMASGVVGALMMVAAGALVAPSSARAAETRTLTVTPATDLDRQVVEVAWTGFAPTRPDGSSAVIVLQCAGNPATLADCYTADPFPQITEGNRILAFTAEDGTGTARFEVRAARDLPALDCSSKNPCSILAYENDGQAPPLDALPTTAVVAPLRFAKSRSDCPAATDFDVRADGSASSAPLFYRWAAERCSGKNTQVIDFTETSSTTGRENFLAGLVDLALTPVPASEEELEAHPDHPEYEYAPIDLTAIAVVFNMEDPFTGRRIDDLVLSPRLVTRLVTNTSIESWLNDPELRRLNPTVRFPSTSLAKPLLRSERDADTRFVTEWMTSSRDAQDFLAGRDPFQIPVNARYRDFDYPVELFESVDDGDPNYLPRTGQNNVALRLFYGVAPNGSLPQPSDLYGYVGIVDLPTARRFGLPTARLVTRGGATVAPTDEAIALGFEAMTKSASGTLVPDPTPASAEAYPLVKVDYAMVPTGDDIDATKKAEIADLLRYAMDEGQEGLPPGFLPLPAALRTTTLRLADDLAGSAVATTTTTLPVPGTTTPTIPYVDPCCSNGGVSYDTTPVPTFTPTPTTSGATSTTVVAASTTTVAAPTPPLPVRGERMGVAMLLGTGGLSLVAWAAGGARSTATRVRTRRPRPTRGTS